MAKRVSNLNVQLTGAPLAIFRAGNDAYLRGDRAEPVLDAVWPGLVYVGFALIGVGFMLLAAFAAVLAYIVVWNSPLAVTTTGVIDGYDGRVVYHYDVDGIRYDKREPVNRVESNWDDGDVPHPVVYLGFQPSESRLDFNVETLDVTTALFALLFVGLLPLGGWYALRAHRRMTGLRDDATHVIEGKITSSIPGPHRLETFVYTAKSPVTGAQISGTVDVGRLSPRFGRLAIGAPVAVLYGSDTLHTIL